MKLVLFVSLPFGDNEWVLGTSHDVTSLGIHSDAPSSTALSEHLILPLRAEGSGLCSLAFLWTCLSIYCCEKTPKPGQLLEKLTGVYSFRHLAHHHHGGEHGWPLGAGVGAETGPGMSFWNPQKPAKSTRSNPSTSSLIILPSSEFHSMVTKHSNVCAYGDYS